MTSEHDIISRRKDVCITMQATKTNFLAIFLNSLHSQLEKKIGK